MKTKIKLIIPLLFSLLLVSANAFSSNSNFGDELEIKKNESKEHYIDQLQAKADEIVLDQKRTKKLKRKADTSSARKALRSQVESYKAELEALDAKAKAVGGGIYIGGGALIAILLVLLLL